MTLARRFAGLLAASCALACLGPWGALAHPMYFNEGSSFLAPYPLEASFEAQYVVGELGPGETDVYRLGAAPQQPISALLLAPLACAEFEPELWLVGAGLVEEAEPAPFALPEGAQALVIGGVWQPISDFVLQARRGPGLQAAFPDDEQFLVVRARARGSYILFTYGQDRIGGTDAGWEALARFNRCEPLASP